MLIIPAIDLKGGKCVRLYKGDFDTVHRVAESAVETAKKFADAGAKLVHMVDLDGARCGVGRNGKVIAAVCEQGCLSVELGGGLRSMDDLKEAEKAGVYRFVIGSAAVTHPEFVAEAVEKYGRRIAVGVDARRGVVRTHGWERDSGLNALEFARKMTELGVKTIIYTDIDTDGTLRGPAVSHVARLVEELPADIIASGGVGNLDDVRRVADTGAAGVIIGKAYYSGAVDIAEAVAIGGVQCLPEG